MMNACLPLLCAFGLLTTVDANGVQQDPPAQDTAETRAVEMLERLVDELLSASPELAKKAGPVQVRYFPSLDVNAFATRDENGAGQLIVLAGIIEAFDGDERLMRAVIAHELAHLIRGHIVEVSRPSSRILSFADVRFHFVRQVEFDADRFGVELLTMAGYERADLKEALLRLHVVHRKYGVSWLQSISDDHGSWVERMARIEPDEARLEALRSFERGLAFIECRRAPQALLAFERALELEPEFDEAQFGVVRARMQIYYDNLPGVLREEWLRPDFGPQLTLDDIFDVRGAAASAADHHRWESLRDLIVDLPKHVEPALYELLLGTVDVIHPAGDMAALSEGVRRLQGGMLDPQIARSGREALRLAFANNAALGLQRLGDPEGAWRILVAELESNFAHARYATVANAAKLTKQGMQGAYGDVFVGMLQRLLRTSRAGSARHDDAVAALSQIGDSIGADLLELEEPSLLQVCRPTELIVGEARLGLFTSLADASGSLGVPDVDAPIHPDYDEFRVVAWNDGNGAPDIVALIENGRALKLTTYRDGSAIVLAPADETDVREIRLTVGSSERELVGLVRNLDLTWPAISGVPLLDRALQAGEIEAPSEESWIYLPDLALGVLVEDGVVRGLTMTSIPRQ